MKRGGLTIKINLTNRWLYTFILIGILAVVGVGVYAATYTASGAGHPYTEISTCAANQILKMNSAGNAWTCVLGSTAIYAYSSCCSVSGVTNLPICIKASGSIPPICSAICGGPGGDPTVPAGFCPNTHLGYLV